MTKKQKAKPILERSYKAREIMARNTNRAIAKRYRQDPHIISQMRKGRDPSHIATGIKRKIRMDFMRYDDAAKDRISLDAVADHLDVGRSTARKWAREFGFAKEGQEQKRPPRPAKPVTLRWPGTPVGRFMVVRLTASPAEVRTYY